MKRTIEDELILNYFLQVEQLYEGLLGLGIRGAKALGKAKQLPLAGIETPAAVATKFNNLKQYQRYIWDKVRTYPSIGGSLKPREVPMTNGNTLYIFARDRGAPGEKPLATMLLNKNKEVVGKDFSRISSQEQEIISNWANNNIIGNAKPYYPSVPMGALVHERQHHVAHQKDSAKTTANMDDFANYKGSNSQAQQILARAHQVSGNSAKNDLEALTIYMGHLGKISQRNSDIIKRDHEIIQGLQADIDAKEKRFQDFNKRVAQAQNVPVQQQAAHAQRLAQAPVDPEEKKNSRLVKKTYHNQPAPTNDAPSFTRQPSTDVYYSRQPSNDVRYAQVAEGKMKAIYTVMKDLYGAMDDVAFKRMYGVSRDVMKQNLDNSAGKLTIAPKPGQLPPAPKIPGPKPVELRGQTPGERPEYRQFFTKKFNNKEEAEAWARTQHLHDYHLVDL